MLGTASFGILIPISAHAQNEEATQSEENAAQGAFDALNAQVSERAGDPSFDYQLGIAALDAGRFTASEIGRLKLAADWVVLSAYNTAAGEGRASPTYSGLARAFQLAGAQSLLLSHWPWRDDVATRLSVATLKASSSGVERSEALRQAQLALIADGSLRGAASPALWAPFVIIE